MTNYSRSVLKSNGLHRPENLPVKFGFSPQIVPANIAKKLRSQVPSQAVFQPLAQTAYVCFHVRKRVHTRLSVKDRTQGHTRRNRGLPDGAAITTLDTYCTFTNIPGPGVRTAYFAALGSWPGGALEERRKPSGQRCAYACRCSEGVAAPLGCVIFLFLSKLWLVCPALRAFCACEAGAVSLPSARFTCCRNAGRPLVKTVHLPFSEIAKQYSLCGPFFC